MRKTRFKAGDKNFSDDSETPQNQEITVKIMHLAGLGEGAGEHDGHKVFVPCTMGGDEVRVKIIKSTKDFSRGELLEVITPSSGRSAPVCKWFGACGGCTLQHLNHEAYRSFKRGMLTEAVRKAGYDPAICGQVYFLEPDSRRRVEFKVHQINGKGELGFFKLNSHQLVPVDHCPILSEGLAACIAPLREWIGTLQAAPFIHAIRISEIDGQLDLVIELSSKALIPPHLLDELKTKLNLKRLTISREGRTLVTVGESVTKLMNHEPVQLPTDIFLQASESGERWLINKVVSSLVGSKRIADLFCGIGTYTFPLAARAKVTAYELDEAMVKVVNQHVKDHTLSAQSRNLYLKPITPKELVAFDALVINPPRDGAKAQVEQIALSGVPKVAMVSCNPATFTRDAGILNKAGYRLSEASGLDQFVFSPHLEIFALFEK